MAAIRYGIVGCGGIGETHAEAVRATEGVRLLACANRSAAGAREFADAYDLDAWYTDVTAMIERHNVDAVSVCTPSGTHAPVTIEAAHAGADVLCEKPLDVYADRMDRMLTACEDAGVTLAGVFQERFQPATRRAKEAIEAGELGEPVLGDGQVKWFRPQAYYDGADWKGTRELDGGVLLSQAIHTIDRLQWLMGGIESVRAVTDIHDRELAGGCETTAGVAVRFENGALGTVSATTATKGGDDRIEINGTDGSITLAGGAIDSFEVGTGERTQYGAETDEVDVHVEPLEWGEGHARVVEDFVDALREGREPAVPGTEARRAVDGILAAHAADKRDESVAVEAVRAGRIPEVNATDRSR
ncbi:MULTISPECIES: Gfo/Idh/MocA family oxidoreductase [unclassified Halorhabdus]|uniref:Gfo/Idh/MocA family protein n=1 Tax=unclassified Halorhabdus TaxID=2621901 RepID=UPI0023DCE5DB|nr:MULTISPECIES: Gfo/Idh/MocA family oxidoreductase [unclassified Halorhabdus]WEL17891.1 UDP-N-acetyl-2-amino-2-deoxyglucuronate dehydrogenase [Halorhabdus sp. SVX81]WEL21772.1 UDP-N-acetyl-2-amino-2-deoxyglucuronate dehydrogenase [Halorhabdus sp. BNX81]